MTETEVRISYWSCTEAVFAFYTTQEAIRIVSTKCTYYCIDIASCDFCWVVPSITFVDLNTFSKFHIYMKNILAYTAGYLDGDGCFFIAKEIRSQKYRNAIIVNSTDPSIVRFFKNHFGGQTRFNKKNPKFKNYNPINTWMITGKNAVIFCKKVIPFLKEKRNDAFTFLDFMAEECKTIKDDYIQKIKDHRNSSNLITKETIEFLNKVEKESFPVEEDFAYLSGFIDAECNFTISKEKPKNRPNYTYKIILQCNNTKSPTIHWLLKKFGGRCYFVPRKEKNPKHKDQVAWRITSKSLGAILQYLLPFLRYKRPVCEQLIEFYKTTLANGGDRQKETFKASYISTVSHREEIIVKVHKLNSKTR